MPAEQAVIVCAPYTRRSMRQVRGNRKVACRGCDKPLVISPLARKEHPDGLAMCIQCVQSRWPGERARMLDGDKVWASLVDPDGFREWTSTPISELGLERIDW